MLSPLFLATVFLTAVQQASGLALAGDSVLTPDSLSNPSRRASTFPSTICGICYEFGDKIITDRCWKSGTRSCHKSCTYDNIQKGQQVCCNIAC
ncbi:hypothetical protein E2P81_ATG04089 [Venturia nashicola]|uniref:Uncharacterized protein n=1 Tax=Venturia nashicola TaxID=86259 RepID=A0A4Z1PQS1_9PEZI|nr:hypothetical protein E6O75_ATG04189 [Venturia nashicola]TLD37277.1 hypothetical protein E2P81_ATG04089 [Venturia nashicola]